MGYKYDEDNKEWVTTEEWNDRKQERTDIEFKVAIGCMLSCLVVFLLLLPARFIKWAMGYDFFPRDISFGQFAVDLCISIPIYLLIAGILVAIFTQQNENRKK